MAKKVFRSEGIETPKAWVVTHKNVTEVVRKIHTPCVVKPMNLGSSVGVAIVKNTQELLPALHTALQLDKRGDMLQVMGSRLDQIQQQVEHFGLVHDNVIAACGGLYQDTISTFRQRIQVHGDMRFLQQPNNAAKIRALLLAGIRSARLWRQLGGHRWQLVFSRSKLLKELYELTRS